MSLPQIAFFSNHARLLSNVYPESRIDRIKTMGELYPTTVSLDNFHDHVESLSGIEYIFSTWGMPALNAHQISEMPELKTVFYGAGTVKYFAEPFLAQGIKVVSAWAANAIPVAEFTVAQVILAAKGYFADSLRLRNQGSSGWQRPTMPGNYDISVSILGAGMVGREVIKRLKQLDVTILVFDPFLDAEQASLMGVEKVGLSEAFSAGFIVSNHLANVKETERMLTAELFRSMQANGVFINTGRGDTVDESQMIEVLKQREDIIALLDVTRDEPPDDDSPLYSMPNVWLSPHIAGSIGNEVVRMADMVIDEFQRELDGDALQYEVTIDMFSSMA